MKTAELIEKFIRKYTIRKGHRSVAEDEAEIKSDLTELLKETAREQRDACATNFSERYGYGNMGNRILNTPLVTNK